MQHEYMHRRGGEGRESRGESIHDMYIRGGLERTEREARNWVREEKKESKHSERNWT